MTRSALLYLLIFAGISLFGCKHDRLHTLRPAEPAVHITGAHQVSPNGSVSFAWAATQLEFEASGSAISASIEDHSTPDETPDADRLLVLVDDVIARELQLKPGAATYDLVTGLDASARHRIRLWKQTDAEVGTVVFRKFDLRGATSIAKRSTIGLLEAVGDSITSGYGDTGEGVSCAKVAANSSSYDSYTAVAARELNLEYRAFSYSGKGLTRNFRASDREPMPAIYGRASPLEAASANGLARPPADYVVLNLGTNDFARGVPDDSQLADALHSLTRSIREYNPRAWLVLAVGPMLADDFPVPQARSQMRRWLKAEVRRLERGGDSRVAFIEFWFDPAEGVGCDYHPNQRTHTRMAGELVTLLVGLGKPR